MPQAHAHNDYEHERPLLDALEQGFGSVEADVHLLEGELYVAHNHPDQLGATQTLRSLYLQPLWARTNGGSQPVFAGTTEPFLLMIDIKTAAGPTYAAIQAALEEFRPLFARVEDGVEVSGPVLVFLSGSRPVEAILSAESFIARLDGRPGDLGQGIPASRMPVVSDQFRKVAGWCGIGRMPRRVRQRLTEYVARVHAEGKRVRFWAHPDRPGVWRALRDCGVDLINTDDLPGLASFLRG
ncbi:MAG: phosphatidylinositol-specific phospholipase C/glycerophosphodiester phosphodiesterase family protein [Lewinella sp.]|nr:phosphatidylinositol-specific phospholipase C/glycerophosphodiester phosphodiesterase family protein [Lewinella sp.]